MLTTHSLTFLSPLLVQEKLGAAAIALHGLGADQAAVCSLLIIG
jgi:hypothetical protein